MDNIGKRPVINAATGYGGGFGMRIEFGGDRWMGMFQMHEAGCIDAPKWILAGSLTRGFSGVPFAEGRGRDCL